MLNVFKSDPEEKLPLFTNLGWGTFFDVGEYYNTNAQRDETKELVRNNSMVAERYEAGTLFWRWVSAPNERCDHCNQDIRSAGQIGPCRQEPIRVAFPSNVIKTDCLYGWLGWLLWEERILLMGLNNDHDVGP
jgi:hypothetical protein